MAVSVDSKLIRIFLFFLENRILYFMQIISSETICMKWQILFWGKNKKKYLKCCLLKFLPSMLSDN